MVLTAASRRFYPLLAPVMMIIIAVCLVAFGPGYLQRAGSGVELKALLVILPYFPYFLFFVAAMIGWRYQNAGMLLSAWMAGAGYLFFDLRSLPDHRLFWESLETAPTGFVVLWLTGLFLLTLFNRRRFSLPGQVIGLSVISIFFLLSAIYFQVPIHLPAIFNHPVNIISTLPGLMGDLMDGPGRFFDNYPRSMAMLKRRGDWLILMGVVLILLVRFFRTNDALMAGYAGVLAVAGLGTIAENSCFSQSVYFSAAGLILVASAVETAFTLAYHDELTGLPSRRRLNEAMASLGKKYTIAMIDVDHFKKFNDTYGHKTGDQALKMLAVNLRGMTGGARTYRYGGEEFTALFPGKSTQETLGHLEKFRERLAATPFIVRDKSRRKGSNANRGAHKRKTGKAIRVTVSIGAAEPSKTLKKPAQVIKAADKALYRAKRAGRNCVMSAAPR